MLRKYVMDYQEIFLTKGTHKTVYMIVNELRYNLWHMDKDCYARMQYLKMDLQNDEIEDIFSILFSHQCRVRNKVVPLISGMDNMTFSFKVKSGIRIYTNDNPLSYLATQCGIRNSDDRERNRRYRRRKKGIYDINFDDYYEYLYSENVDREAIQQVSDTYCLDYIEFQDKRLQYCHLLSYEDKNIIAQLLMQDNKGKFLTNKQIAKHLEITYNQLCDKLQNIKRQLEIYASLSGTDS